MPLHGNRILVMRVAAYCSWRASQGFELRSRLRYTSHAELPALTAEKQKSRAGLLSMKRSAVATPHPAAAAAAREILMRGGNAIDAAIGAMLACCVATPGAVGLGGYGGSLVAYLAAHRKAVAIDFDSRAPLAYRPEWFGGLA